MEKLSTGKQLSDGPTKEVPLNANLNRTVFYLQRCVLGEMVLARDDDVFMIKNERFPMDRFPEVEILRIKAFLYAKLTFPYILLERFLKLKELHVSRSSFKEIFPSHVRIVDQIPPFKKLHLGNMYDLSSYGAMILLKIKKCMMFKTVLALITLAPFDNLTELKVDGCHQLVYLMTNSTAKSLMSPETLEISYCEKMEEIVKNETNEDVEGGITFNALRILKLTRLPRLNTEEDKTDFNIEGRPANTRCGNIFRPLFSYHKVLFPKLEILELSHLNHLIPSIWDDQLLHNSFSNLKTLTVECCGFVKLVPLHVLKSLNNLEELEVFDCDLLEMVFDFEDLNNYKEMVSSSVVVQLKKLKLQNLPKLKNVCSNHRQGAISLAPSVVSSPNGLYHQIEEIRTKQEGKDDKDKEIFFSKFEFLNLYNLSRLESFYSHNYTFTFPLLESVTIMKCP